MISRIHHYRFNLILLITFFKIICFSLSQLNPSAPGISACVYFGAVTEFCGTQTSVPYSALPSECTSFEFIGISSNGKFDIFDSSGIPGNEAYLRSVLGFGKPIFLVYGHGSEQEWANVLAGNVENGGENAKTEMTNLKTYLDKYENVENVKGLVLTNITIYVGRDKSTISDYTANFIVYLKEMRSTFPDMAIGLELNGRELINYYDSGSTLEWLNFNELDSFIDFYVLELFLFNNPCTDNFKIGGTTPVDGTANHTLTKLVGHTVKNGIPKTKTYFEYRTSARRQNVDDFEGLCELTNVKFCASPSLDGWCADNTQSYYDKGNFAKVNGIGFFAINVDMDDPNGTCGCAHKGYPAFHDILDGFTNAKIPETCVKLDKP